MERRSAELQTVWVLHSRPYRESSLIVDLLTWENGRISVVVNGARGAATKKGRPRRGHLLQPFTQLLASWQGKTELKTLKALEQEHTYSLVGIRLLSGLYVNELLQRVLPQWLALEGVPELYIWLLQQLASNQHDGHQGIERSHLERTLRLFEKRLLSLLGYGLPLEHEADGGEPIEPSAWYRYDVESGFKLASAQHNLFPGTMLLALSHDRIADEHLLACKTLMRTAIAPLLDGRPLRSRELFKIRDKESQI